MKTRSMRTGFTLLELLVVLGIILILISILIPTVSKVRRSAQTAGVKAEISNISGAIERFYQDQHQYPGPLPDDWLYTAGRGAGTKPQITLAAGVTGTLDATHITQEENLLLGLLGGLAPAPVAGQYTFDPSMIGHGGITIGTTTARKVQAFMSDDPKIRSPYTGKPYTDGTGINADDSSIPEFVDTYPNPMPILYLRAHVGTTGVIRNNVPENAANPRMQYDLSDIYPYTSKPIGVGKTINPKDYTPSAAKQPSAGVLPHGLQSVTPADGPDSLNKGGKNYTYPYDAVPYLMSPSVPVPSGTTDFNTAGTARAKDTYILISAGPDRVYGTADDVCSFGSVTE